jgi:hypothetical protein
MHVVNKRPRAISGAVLILVSLLVAACGSASGGSGDAGSLLSQTFGGAHKVNSGSLRLALTVSPSGSGTLKGPITFSLEGPFQSRGAGKLPQSNFTISLGANGKRASLGVLSTGTAGYVTLQGESYQLPPATFQKLESSFAQVASGSHGSGSGAFKKLGIQPLNWLRNPTVVGTEAVGGASTTHIHAGVNVSALVNDLSTVLKKASSLGVSGARSLSGGLPASTRNQIAAAIRNPAVDVWTGSSDKTLRKLQVGLSVPVSGQLSSATGGLRSAGIGLTLEYANLNQPQTITPPTSVRPFSEFATKLRAFVQTLQSGLGASSAGGGGGSANSAASVQSYSKCIQAAGNDVAKMQQCAALLNSG